VLSIRFCFFQSTRSPGEFRPVLFASRQRRLVKIRVELVESSPRLAARDGMEQEPYEFGRPSADRLRSSPFPESKGKERAALRLSLKDARKNPHARLS